MKKKMYVLIFFPMDVLGTMWTPGIWYSLMFNNGVTKKVGLIRPIMARRVNIISIEQNVHANFFQQNSITLNSYFEFCM